MRTHLFYLLAVISLFTLAQGCDSGEPSSPSNSLNITLKADASYQYDLGFFGDEEGAEISIQPNHFQISKIDRAINSGKIIYTYIPSPGFTGTDSVKLKSMRGSNGASANNTTTLVIKFRITG